MLSALLAVAPHQARVPRDGFGLRLGRQVLRRQHSLRPPLGARHGAPGPTAAASPCPLSAALQRERRPARWHGGRGEGRALSHATYVLSAACRLNIVRLEPVSPPNV